MDYATIEQIKKNDLHNADCCCNCNNYDYRHVNEMDKYNYIKSCLKHKIRIFDFDVCKDYEKIKEEK